MSIKETILYDLEALKDSFILNDKKDFNYHFKLLEGNLKDSEIMISKPKKDIYQKLEYVSIILMVLFIILCIIYINTYT